MTGDHEATKKLDVDAIWFKGQRVLRTVFTTVLTVLPIVPQVVQVVQGQWPAATGLTAVAVQAVAINAALTAIIAIPTVNTWLTAIGLGSVPRKEAKANAAAKSQELQPAQYEPSDVDYRSQQGD
ncbi:hypothetical protein DEI99_005340 [Curtobacterium sp. MCLR17_036]|uniref:hypothetical protein n=1 Tax=Curtobacterium sp. MCLR17_036 TaxID=2175620 RepID=UPI000DA9DC0A|nr:hypothetical protein [Curtobacterium sp. MCLR17_036]WIE65963.1 hypothetical protein DEI99_005340 [Curtobacterium sp. MCLR17_036]